MRFDWEHCGVCKSDINLYINGARYTYGWVNKDFNTAVYRPGGEGTKYHKTLGRYPTTFQAMRALRKRARLGLIGGEIKI